ncbi:MAG: hypothetical protein AAF914_07050 [Pseudomonadota bacterium]
MRQTAFIAAALTALVLAPTGHAATYSIFVAAGTSSSPDGSFNFLGDSVGDDDTLLDQESFTGLVAPDDVPEEASYFSSLDARTGEIKLDARVSHDLTGATPGSSTGTVSIVNPEIYETVTVTGTGTLEMYMALDAAWDFGSGADSSGLSAYIQIAPAAPGVSSVTEVFTRRAGNGDAPGSVTNTLLAATFDYVDAVDAEARLTWGINANLVLLAFEPGENAFASALNTATLFYRTTGSLSVVPSSSIFLENEVFTADAGSLLPGATPDPAPIPLPASGFLLLGAMLGLPFLAKRRVARAGRLA